MKRSNIIGLIIIVLFILALYKNVNITGYYLKPSKNEFYFCKIDASNKYNECLKNRTYWTRREAVECHKKYTKSINECIKTRDENRKRRYV